MLKLASTAKEVRNICHACSIPSIRNSGLEYRWIDFERLPFVRLTISINSADDPNAVHGSLLPTPADVDVPPDLASYSVEVQRTMADFQWLYKRLVAAGSAIGSSADV